MLPASFEWERVALRWRGLAERRRDHYADLYRSGRWRRYYTEQQFLVEMREAVALAERWTQIAPERERAQATARRTTGGVTG